MKLDKPHREFRNPKVFYPDPKAVELDRVLVRFYLLLHCNGARPATKTQSKADWGSVAHHRDRLARMQHVEGFDRHGEVARAWLESDVFDVVNRGKGKNEGIASLRPLHLHAPKIHIAPRCRDYNVADHLYACLHHESPPILAGLRSFLDHGHDPGTDNVKPEARLDLETLTLLKLVESGAVTYHPAGEPVAWEPPVCPGQARVLADDVARILAYRDAVPRAVLIDWLRTLLGLHTALYTLRVARQLPGWIADKSAHAACRQCPVRADSDAPFEGCPYGMRLVTDAGDDFRSPMARMAQASAAAEWGRMEQLIRALFTVNQLLRAPAKPAPQSPADAVDLLADPPSAFEGYFEAQLAQIRDLNSQAGELPADLAALLDLELPAFDRFIEVITHIRYKHHREYLYQFLDKTLQKNTEYGAASQGKSSANPRRFTMGSRLLELLVQLAVLQRVEAGDGKRHFASRALLVDDFVRWVEHRYGLVLAGCANADAVPTVEELAALRFNGRNLKARLRECGFFEDLSDAFNAQTIRPRYPIEVEAL